MLSGLFSHRLLDGERPRRERIPSPRWSDALRMLHGEPAPGGVASGDIRAFRMGVWNFHPCPKIVTNVGRPRRRVMEAFRGRLKIYHRHPTGSPKRAKMTLECHPSHCIVLTTRNLPVKEASAGSAQWCT